MQVLTPGTRLGPYDIQALIGRGGMGEVYRARDTKLGREVAVKILPEAFASDPDRLMRFEREARTLASLNHPHIAQVYGIEDSGTTRALVMELAEGEDLSARIARGPIPMDEALPIARQVAEALEAAHEAGIIHRDLKPANIKVRDDGTVKVLDFGLAKALDVAPGALANAATITSPAMTMRGVILGTAAYMSPEQARGKRVDGRADIWAFGCVLFEMITANRPFLGDGISETVAHVLTAEPRWDALPTGLQSRVRELLQRCLQKDVRQRWQAIGDVRIELEHIIAGPDRARTAVVGRDTWQRRAGRFAAAALIGAALATAGFLAARPGATPGVIRFTYSLPPGQYFQGLAFKNIAISPDGTRIAYVSNNALYVKRLNEVDGRRLAATTALINVPCFSPDGQWVAYLEGSGPADWILKKIPADGGAPVVLATTPVATALTWSHTDEILFAQEGKGVARVPARGGAPEIIVRSTAGESVHSPQMLPGGSHVLFTSTADKGIDRWSNAQLVVASLGSDARTVVIDGATDGRYVPTGHIIYSAGTNILAVPFDIGGLRVAGGAVTVVEGVSRSTGPLWATSHFDVAASGTLIYLGAPHRTGDLSTLLLISRTGERTAVAVPPGQYSGPRIAPDGKSIAVTVSQSDRASDIWIHDREHDGSLRRLTFNGRARAPVWTRDGKHLVFAAEGEDRAGLWWQPSDGTKPAARLTTADVGLVHTPQSSAPGGIVMFLEERRPDLRVSDGESLPCALRVVALDGDRTPTRFLDLPQRCEQARFSPDGRWFAYTSTEVGTSAEVMVRAVPPTEAKVHIGAPTKTSAIPNHVVGWSPDGSELFYTESHERFLAATVTVQPMFKVGTTTPLPVEANHEEYDITPDQVQFLIASRGATRTGQMNVVVNWLEELKQKVQAP